MFRIDKSLVDTMSLNKPFVMITHEDNIDETNAGQSQKPDKLPEIDPESVEDAGEKARIIIENAQRHAEEIKSVAYKEGYKQGREESLQRAAQQAKLQKKTVDDFISRLRVHEQTLFNEIQDSVLELSLDIAEKIVNTELKRDDTLYVGIIKKAVSRLKESDKFKLRVSQSEYDKYFKDGAAWLEEETGHELLGVVCDHSMQEGEMVVESGHTVISAGVPLQLNKIKRQLSEEPSDE